MDFLAQRLALMEQQMAMLCMMVADMNAMIDLIANESGSSQATPDRDTQALSLFKDPQSKLSVLSPVDSFILIFNSFVPTH